MSRLVVDEQHQLKEVSTLDKIEYPAYLKGIAHIISFIFHPLFIPVYLVYFLIRIHAHFFAGITEWSKLQALVIVAMNTLFFPVVSIFLLKGLKFIDSVFLRTQKDRIIPYMVTMIFYFWTWNVFKNNNAPDELVAMSLAVFIASIFGFLANIYIKVSMHAIAVGVMTGFIAGLTLTDSLNLTLYLAITILISGIVCTARLIVSDHSQKEIYLGVFLGLISVGVAWVFVF